MGKSVKPSVILGARSSTRGTKGRRWGPEFKPARAYAAQFMQPACFDLLSWN